MAAVYYADDGVYEAETTAGVWGAWSSCTAATTASTNYIWGQWAANCSTATTATTAAWEITNSTTTQVWVKWTKVRDLTADERARREEQRRKWAEEEAARAAAWEAGRPERERLEAERKKAEEAADKRAEELLLAHLDSEQKTEYRKDRSFHVRAKDGRRYRIRRAWAGHVRRVDDHGKEVERFCIHPRESVPLPDNQLFAKLMLETDPEGFRRTANVSACA